MTRACISVVASVATRLGLGAYPLAFVIAFGSTYGKQAFDLVAAAFNWANYLNILVLSGFALVPPVVARLRVDAPAEEDRNVLRDHVALMHVLAAIGVPCTVLLAVVIEFAFPALATFDASSLRIWFVLFACQALLQLPLTLWLGVAQAAGRYAPALLWAVVPRALGLVVVPIAGASNASPTIAIGANVLLLAVGQWGLTRAARIALETIDPGVLSKPGIASAVLRGNLSAALLAFSGALVSIVPVTIVGRLLPSDVGVAHVMVTLSNAIGAVIVAAFFPMSLALAQSAGQPDWIRDHCRRVARGVAGGALLLISATWIAYPLCDFLYPECTLRLYLIGTVIAIGAGFRLAALGTYHVALFLGSPFLILFSAIVEAAAVLTIVWFGIRHLGLAALAIAFLAGGILRMGLSLTLEARWLKLRSS